MTISEKTDIVIPADHVAGPKQGQWTYSHYAALPDDGKRYEIIDGVLYMAPPSPMEWHQRSAGRFFHFLLVHIEFAGLGRVYPAPLDVELAVKTVVEPDVIVLLNESCGKIVPSRIIGAPDRVVEVLSPGTRTYDRQLKAAKYAQAGVKEYWIADPMKRTVEVQVLEKDSYCSIGVFHDEEALPSKVVPGFPVQVKQFFPE